MISSSFFPSKCVQFENRCKLFLRPVRVGVVTCSFQRRRDLMFSASGKNYVHVSTISQNELEKIKNPILCIPFIYLFLIL